MRFGTRLDERRAVRALGDERELGAPRAEPADGERSRDVDGVQHGHLAHPVGDSHEGDGARARISSRTRCWGRPLGFTFAPWTRDPQGIYLGGNEMVMTPRQMIALGELYLNRGRAGTRQVVPAEWVDASCTPRTRSRWDRDREYGYGWWSQDFAGHRACFAWGFGGQYIFVFRGLDLGRRGDVVDDGERRAPRLPPAVVRSPRTARAAAPVALTARLSSQLPRIWRAGHVAGQFGGSTGPEACTEPPAEPTRR